MSSENRRLRNRLSQKAFRARQAMRIKELEERLDQEPTSDSARTAQLQDVNATLRNQLLECHKKVSSLQISMKTLVATTAVALGFDASAEDNTNDNPVLCNRCKRSIEVPEQQSSPGDEGYSSHTSRQDLEPVEEETAQQESLSFPTIESCNSHNTMDLSNCEIQNTRLHPANPGGVTIFQDEQNSLCSENGPFGPVPLHLGEDNLFSSAFGTCFDSTIPQHDNTSLGTNNVCSLVSMPQLSNTIFNDIGLEQYGEILNRSPPITAISGIPFKRTNSIFSDHISTVEFFLQQKWLKQSPSTASMNQLSESIKFMLSVFVSVSWNTMSAWHTYTKAHIPLKDLIAWRVTRSTEAYSKIIPTYRPSKLQMTTQYPAIIDWIPWASLRDKLIIYHSANPCLDSIICDIGNSYVVPTDLSKLVAGLPVVNGYLSVWDLVRAIAPDATRPDESSSPVGITASLGIDSEGDHVPGRRYSYSSHTAIQRDSDNIAQTPPLHGNFVMEDDDDFCATERPSLPAPDSHTLFSNRAFAIQAFRALGMDKGAATFCLDPEFFGRHPELYDPSCDIMASGVPLRPSTHWSVPTPKELNINVIAQYREFTKWSFEKNAT